MRTAFKVLGWIFLILVALVAWLEKIEWLQYAVAFGVFAWIAQDSWTEYQARFERRHREISERLNQLTQSVQRGNAELSDQLLAIERALLNR